MSKLDHLVMPARAAIWLAPLAERAHLGSPTLTAWCPTCRERALPMRNGTCGFCDSKLAAPDGEPTTRPFIDRPPAGCRCTYDCDFPCWMRAGLTEENCSCGCAPLPRIEEDTDDE